MLEGSDMLVRPLRDTADAKFRGMVFPQLHAATFPPNHAVVRHRCVGMHRSIPASGFCSEHGASWRLAAWATAKGRVVSPVASMLSSALGGICHHHDLCSRYVRWRQLRLPASFVAGGSGGFHGYCWRSSNAEEVCVPWESRLPLGHAVADASSVTIRVSAQPSSLCHRARNRGRLVRV